MNHLSHLLLTLELLPIMLDTASSTGDGRIVIVSSDGHKWGQLNPDNLEGQLSYSGFKFYCNSKLYNVTAKYSLLRMIPIAVVSFVLL